MNRLLKISERRLKLVPTGFTRYLYQKFDWEQPLILLTGARGTGKTTLLLQRMKVLGRKAVYLSLDDFYFENNRLLLLLEELYEKGVHYFFLDEVHQYEHWSKDLKNLYDNYPDIKIIATGSSVLQVTKGQADLSRRASIYHLQGLSFREFLNFKNQQNLPAISLAQALENHQSISESLNDQFDVLEQFAHYLNYGYYPFFKTDKLFYHLKIQQILQLIIEMDIPATEKISYSTVRTLKKLLYIISQSVPFTPNIQKLSEKINSPRNTVLKVLDLLEKANVLNLLKSNTKGGSYLQKPEKIYLENPNLAFTLSEGKPNKGNLRETFFFNQLNVGHALSTSKFADFMVDDYYTFEIGGATKTKKQIQGIPQAFIAADDIKNGAGNKIPLWLFGFLY